MHRQHLSPHKIDTGIHVDDANDAQLNAIKYSPPGRSIRVSVASEHDAPDRPECRLKVSVEDQGIGIAEDKLATLFAQRPEASENGAGLGLRVRVSALWVRV